MTTSRATADAIAPLEFRLEGGLTSSLAAGLTLALGAEGSVLHVWIATRSHAWAWAVTALNAATLVWLWREVRAGSRSTVAVGERELVVNAGSRLRCRIPRDAIERVNAVTWRSVPHRAAGYVDTAKPLEPNVLIGLRTPVRAILPLGLARTVTRIGVRVSDPATFVAALGATRGSPV